MVLIVVVVTCVTAQMLTRTTALVALAVDALRHSTIRRRTGCAAGTTVFCIVVGATGQAACATANVGSGWTAGATTAVDAGGVTEARFLTIGAAAAAVIRIVVRMTGEIARRSADMPVGRTTGATGIIDTSRATVVRSFATGTAVTATAWIGIGETLIVVRIWSDPAGMQSGITGHLALTVEAGRVATNRSVAGQTTRTAMFLVIVRITIDGIATCAFVETGLALDIAASVDANRVAGADRIRTVGA